MPDLPVGLATKLTAFVAAVFYAVGAITAIVDGNVTQETVTAAVLGTAAVITLALGRYAQRVAQILSKNY